MTRYYYQELNEIGKEIALLASSEPMTDTKRYRSIDKDYYDEACALLAELARESEENP